MLAAFIDLLASEKSASEEGRDVVLMMLAVGAVFVGVVLIGDLWNWHSRKRHNARH